MNAHSLRHSGGTTRKRLARAGLGPLLMLEVALGSTITAQSDSVVPNGSFELSCEEDRKRPAGWTLQNGGGQWTTGDTPDGTRFVVAQRTGDDKSSSGEFSSWVSDPMLLEPQSTYRLRFQARRVHGTTGTPVSGPSFCNRDLRGLTGDWRAIESYFTTPLHMTEEIRRLRFGLWQGEGAVAFDAVSLTPTMAVHRRFGDGIVLGEGESLRGNTYLFEAPFRTASANQARPLARHQCSFNTDRWLFDADSEVVYRHSPGSRQIRASVHPQITYYVAGELVVAASTDGKEWRELGACADQASEPLAIPAELQRSAEIWIRLTARSKPNETRGPYFQVGGYQYQAELEGPAHTFTGSTNFLSVTRNNPKLGVQVTGIGEVVPGGENVLTLSLANRSASPLTLRPRVIVRGDNHPAPVVFPGEVIRLGPQERNHLARIRYEITDAGGHDLRIVAEGDAEFSAETRFEIPLLHAANYGQVLPLPDDSLAIWWCSSGWKVSATRPVPSAPGEAIVIHAAANESEAAQLVLRPTKDLGAITASVGNLRSPSGASISADHIDLLRVRYVAITQPTDQTGSIDLWPDPLPPLVDRSLVLTAGRNQPLWVRVHVPKGTPPGTYTGAIQLRGDGTAARVPLQVTVYGFALPDRMTCETAFGLNVRNIWQYQGLTSEADRREVLAKYHRNFASHHISPYTPAPLDPIRVAWRNPLPWLGGSFDTRTVHGGNRSLFLEDNSPTENVSFAFRPMIAIPDGGVRLELWHRAPQAGHKFLLSLTHHDRNGDWLRGKNRDLTVTAGTEWTEFKTSVTEFPAEATHLRLTLRATPWSEEGTPTGSVWIDDVRLSGIKNGSDLIRGGDFEPDPLPAPEPKLDFTAWDRAMERAISEYHFNSFRVGIPGLGGGSFLNQATPRLEGFEEGTPQYESGMRSYLSQLESHLEQKGWLGDAYVYWFDEPEEKDYPFVMNGFGKLKRWAPGLRRMLTEQVEDGLIGGPNLWCPVSPQFDPARAAERQAQGDEFWWYLCTSPKAPFATIFIDHPGTELRVWLWQTWQRNISGILVWESAFWNSSTAYPDPAHPQNPYEDPMGWVQGFNVPTGIRRPWGNGDGRFLYPPESCAAGNASSPVLDGPVDSIRWEMLRDGIEDYEYLAMLKRLLAKVGSQLPADQRSDYMSLLEVPSNITSDLTSFTTDPATLTARRHQIAKAIAVLSSTTP